MMIGHNAMPTARRLNKLSLRPNRIAKRARCAEGCFYGFYSVKLNPLAMISAIVLEAMVGGRPRASVVKPNCERPVAVSS